MYYSKKLSMRKVKEPVSKIKETKYIGRTVKVYQHYRDEPKHPFKAKIIQDNGSRWKAEYKNKDGVLVSINVNKGCCSTIER